MEFETRYIVWFYVDNGNLLLPVVIIPVSTKRTVVVNLNNSKRFVIDANKMEIIQELKERIKRQCNVETINCDYTITMLRRFGNLLPEEKDLLSKSSFSAQEIKMLKTRFGQNIKTTSRQITFKEGLC